jgi:hypothetical protein
MHQKNLIIAIALICSTMHAHNISQSPKERFKQFDYSLDPAQQVILKTTEKRLAALEEEEKSQYSHSQTCFALAVISGIVGVLGITAKSSEFTWGGGLGAAGFTIGGSICKSNENTKAKTRQEERARIIASLNTLRKEKSAP